MGFLYRFVSRRGGSGGVALLELHTYECDTSAFLIAPCRDEAQIGSMSAQSAVVVVAVAADVHKKKKDSGHDGGDIRERKVREKGERGGEEEGGGCVRARRLPF